MKEESLWWVRRAPLRGMRRGWRLPPFGDTMVWLVVACWTVGSLVLFAFTASLSNVGHGTHEEHAFDRFSAEGGVHQVMSDDELRWYPDPNY